MEGLIWQLISGAAGGNLAGLAMKAKSLGTLWNSVVGVLGGGIGGQLLSAFTGGGGWNGRRRWRVGGWRSAPPCCGLPVQEGDLRPQDHPGAGARRGLCLGSRA